MAGLLCRIILQGLATRSPADAALDRSKAFAAADDVIATWSDDSDADPSDKAALVRAVARTEFGRRGYEVTTIRDIASAAGLGTGTVYRVIGSRTSCSPRSWSPSARRWRRAGSTSCARMPPRSKAGRAELGQRQRARPVFRRVQDPARLDASIAPDTPSPGWLYATRLRQMKTLLSGDPVRGDRRRRAVHRDVGTLRGRPAVDTGEHPPRRRQTRGTGARPRHRAARRRRARQVNRNNPTRY